MNELRPAYVEYGIARPLSEAEMAEAQRNTGLALPDGWNTTRGYIQRMEVAFATEADASAVGLAKGMLLYKGSELPSIAATVDVDLITVVAECEQSHVELELSDVSNPLARKWADFVLSLAPRELVQTSVGRGFVSGSGAALDLANRLVRINYDAGSGGDDEQRLRSSSSGMRGFFESLTA